MPEPVHPTRIIPPGAPLPAPIHTAPPLPPRPPGPGDIPPWREPPPPPAPPHPLPPAGPVEVHVTVDLAPPVEPEPAPASRWNWTWLRDWIRTRQTLIGLAIAVTPSPAYGHSLTTAWAATLHDARDTGSLRLPYGLAAAAITLAFTVDRHRARWWTRTLLIVTALGATGALGWYDPVTWMTGVRP